MCFTVLYLFMQDKIIIRGARVHNLKNIDLEIPKNKLVVFTGISGSGKSSLAFDTIYAEGQRRYVESLSAYARQFLGLMEKPDVDQIDGLSPAISIDQKSTSRNPRSTVGTVTEVYDYLRLLFARIGIPHCSKCGKIIQAQTPQQMVDQILKLPKESKIYILSPVVEGRKGEYQELFKGLTKKGYVRVRINNTIYDLAKTPKLDRYKQHQIEVVVDRLVFPIEKQRLTESVETALRLGEGVVRILVNEKEEHNFSQEFACLDCGISLPEIEPRSFSFNSPYGACAYCHGLGITLEVDRDRVFNKELNIAEGGILPWSRLMTEDSWQTGLVKGIAQNLGFSLHQPIRKLPLKVIEILLNGSREVFKVIFRNRFGQHKVYYSDFEGIIPYLKRRFQETESQFMKVDIQKYLLEQTCPECGGTRLKKEFLSVKVGEESINQITLMSVSNAINFFEKLKLTDKQNLISGQILKEIKSRLKFLFNVGLGYLTLDRSATTLSGGESQRIRLASQIGSGLTGVLYVLDEPSVGLHQKDNHSLLDSLIGLRDLGNTVIVVEHDQATIETADWVVDIGPGAGERGGKIVAQGPPSEIKKDKASLTGLYLSGQRKINFPPKERKFNSNALKIIGAEQNNLKNIDVSIPIGKFICVTGLSGSGKSSLINDILYRALSQRLSRSLERPGKFKELHGVEYIDKVINIDQSPIGRTPRSNPLTYTGAFGLIRDLFAHLPESRARGYSPGRFSFNVRGGRCEACEGEGVIKIEMQFLPDVYITCETCGGKRYNREALEIQYKGKNISEVLDMTVESGLEFFTNIPSLQHKLQTLDDVGLGYLRLGQSATTLSGGEAQRVKLSAELSRRATGKTLYLLDEPTTGLHFADIVNLLKVLHRLVDKGNTVVVIEHNLDVIKTADYIIDLGPEGGDRGGEIVATGTPEEVSTNSNSYTGQYLKSALKRAKVQPITKVEPLKVSSPN